MSSTYTPPECRETPFEWRAAGLRYFTYKHFLNAQFGCRVQRVSVDALFSCPHRPHREGEPVGPGCIFCDNQSFSPSRRLRNLEGLRLGVRQQIDEGILRLRRRYKDCDRYIAYFQPATNTYAPVDRLQEVYDRALSHPDVVGLAIGTRPDCVSDEVLDLLEDYAQRVFVSVEYGVQTMHDRSLEWMNRGHHHAATVDAIARSHGRGFEIGAHIILGLPGETATDNLATARELARLKIQAVKFHNLFAVENTPLAELVRQHTIQFIDRQTYVTNLVNMLEVLPAYTVIQRIVGDAPKKFLICPTWCRDKTSVRLAILEELERRDTWQGREGNIQ